jgi:hypothetical protein
MYMYCIQHSFICCPSDSTVSEDAGIEPRIVATSALAVRRSNHSARSHICTVIDGLYRAPALTDHTCCCCWYITEVTERILLTVITEITHFRPCHVRVSCTYAASVVAGEWVALMSMWSRWARAIRMCSLLESWPPACFHSFSCISTCTKEDSI